ncbi:unnamed protein product [Tetraodon nigroviridis]|uniref:(spotted green pufferfish) hypothetical protein n=1 Tax=Tetraodon nigroviridis TaxID=99883 RepID=Q4SW46_TETNG|nr:unnamed protein product [Tetraodon nigroviridis]
MASISQSEPDIPDNHRDSWLALLSAAEAYSQKSGCDLAILTAWRKFPSAEGHARREGGGVFPKDCEFSYSVWGQGFLAESARRYVDDISVLHSTTMLMAQKHTRQAGGGGAKGLADLRSEPGQVLRSRPFPPSGVFSMDEDSLSRDCEPFWSDGEEESTDGQWRPRLPPAPLPALTLLSPQAR